MDQSARGSDNSGKPALRLRRVVLPPSSSRIGSLPALHRSPRRFLKLCKAALNELKLVKNLDGMVVEILEHLYFQVYGHGSGEFLMAAIKFVGWVQNFASLPRAMRALEGYRQGLGCHCHG